MDSQEQQTKTGAKDLLFEQEEEFMKQFDQKHSELGGFTGSSHEQYEEKSRFSTSTTQELHRTGGDDILSKITTTTVSNSNIQPGGADTTFHVGNVGAQEEMYFDRVSPNMMDFGFDPAAPSQTGATKESQNREVPHVAVCPGPPEPEVEFFQVENNQSQARGKEFEFTAPSSVGAPGIPTKEFTAYGLSSSLDEIEQPKFYESEDSSSNRTGTGTGTPENLSTSQHQEYTPGEGRRTEGSPNKAEGISAVKSPFELGEPDEDSLDEPLPPQFAKPGEATPSPDFRLHEEVGHGLHKSEPMEFREIYGQERAPSPVPGYQLDSEDLMVDQFNLKHSELSSFLQESTNDFPPSPIDNRSDSSVSPNPTPFDSKVSDAGQEKKIVEESLAASKIYHQEQAPAYQKVIEQPKQEPLATGKHYYEEDIQPPAYQPEFSAPPSEKAFYEEQQLDSGDFGRDDDFEVVPPIPSHRNMPDYSSSDFMGSLSEPPKLVDLSPEPTPTKPVMDLPSRPSAYLPPPEPPKPVIDEKPKIQEKFEEIVKPLPKEELAKPVEKKQEDELAEFLPSGSFETIPSSYSASVSKKVEQEVVKNQTAEFNFEVSEDAQKILNIVNPGAWFDPNKLHPKVSELVYWRDPKKSGVVFGSIFVVLIALCFLSFISVVAYTSLAVLTGTFAFRVYKQILQAVQKTNDGPPFKEYLEADLSVQNEKSEEVYKAIVNYLNVAVIKLRHYFLVEDIVDSAKFGVALYLLTYLGSWFNGLTLLIIGFVALFALPKVYESNKAIIDQYLDLASAKIAEVNSKVSAAIPWGKKEKAQ